MSTLEVLEKLKKEFQQHVHPLMGTNCDNSIAIRNSGFECCIKLVDEEIERIKKEESSDG